MAALGLECRLPGAKGGGLTIEGALGLALAIAAG